MPEGHTIHRVARDHNRHFIDQSLDVSSPQGRFRAGAKRLNRHALKKVEAYGKHLFYWWQGGQVLHIHLGLYGKFRNHCCPPPEPRGAVRLRIVGERQAFDLNGPNTCEIITNKKHDALCGRLGQDPLRADADPHQAWDRIRRSRSTIGKLLLDQSIIAGVGNVYRAEALYVTRIHPDRSGIEISRAEFDRLWRTLTEWLRIGVKYNRIITAHPKLVDKPLGRPNSEERLLIYKRTFCPECHAEVASWDSGARTIYACPICQT